MRNMNREKEYLSGIKDMRTLFSQILEISREQLELAEDSSKPDFTEKMMDLLHKRKKLMNRIDLLSGKIKRFESAPTDSGSHGDVTKYPEKDLSIENIGNGKEQILDIIYSIQENDRKSQATINRVFKQVKSKLANAKINKKAYNAYAQLDTYSEGWFFDGKK